MQKCNLAAKKSSPLLQHTEAIKYCGHPGFQKDLNTGRANYLMLARTDRITKNPNSEHLYLEKIDIKFNTLQVGSKLVKVIPQTELLMSKVLVITNMKPRKLAGIPSEGMLLAVHDEENIKVLRPPKCMLTIMKRLRLALGCTCRASRITKKHRLPWTQRRRCLNNASRN